MNAQEYGGKFGDFINLARMQRQLIEHEGMKLKPYRCTAGTLTIGVGRNLDDTSTTGTQPKCDFCEKTQQDDHVMLVKSKDGMGDEHWICSDCVAIFAETLGNA